MNYKKMFVNVAENIHVAKSDQLLLEKLQNVRFSLKSSKLATWNYEY